MSGWVGQRTCAECGYEGPEPDFAGLGLDECGNPYIVAASSVALFDVLVCRGCSEAWSEMTREAMARAVARLMRSQFQKASA